MRGGGARRFVWARAGRRPRRLVQGRGRPAGERRTGVGTTTTRTFTPPSQHPDPTRPDLDIRFSIPSFHLAPSPHNPRPTTPDKTNSFIYAFPKLILSTPNHNYFLNPSTNFPSYIIFFILLFSYQIKQPIN